MKQQMQMLWPTFKAELQNIAVILPLMARTVILPMPEGWANSNFSPSPEVAVSSSLVTVYLVDKMDQLVTW